MPFDTAEVPPETRLRDGLARRRNALVDAVPKPLALNLRADIGVRIAGPRQSEPRSDQEARWRFLDRAAGRTR